MRRNNMLIGLAAASLLATAPAAASGPKRKAKPVTDSKPLPPSTMTRQQRRHAEREALKDPRRWDGKRGLA